MFIEELQKIENKAVLLYEMLDNVKPGEKLNANEVMKVRITDLKSGHVYIIVIYLQELLL